MGYLKIILIKEYLRWIENNLNMLNSYQELEDEQIEGKQNKSEIDDDANKRVFDIKKMKTKKDSMQGSSYNVSYEEQKNNVSNGSKSIKTQNNGSNSDSNVSTRNTTNYILIDKGKVVIKGNEIETLVPCDIETINNKISMISPRCPVKVTMLPLSLNKPQVYNPKSQSFISKEFYQYGSKGSNVEGTSLNSLTSTNLSGCNQNMSMTGNYPFEQIDNLLQLISKSYWPCNWEEILKDSSLNKISNIQNNTNSMFRNWLQAEKNVQMMFSSCMFNDSNYCSCESLISNLDWNHIKR